MPGKPKILIADDDEYILMGLYDLLSEDYKVVKAENGEIALELLKGNSFDLAILDIMMPKLDGYKLAEKLNELKIDTPFIFLTAKTQMKNKIKGLSLGAEDYITKPFLEEELLLRIRRKLYLQEKLMVRNKRLETIYHNIINPINVVKGFLEILKETIEAYKKSITAKQLNKDNYIVNKKETKLMIQDLDNTIPNITNAVDELVKMSINYAEIYNSFEVRLANSPVLLSQLISDIKFLAKSKNVAIKINDNKEKIILNIDYQKISKVFYEIIDNSILHNENHIPKLLVTTKTKDQYTIFSFTDNGRGINKEDFNNVFKEFWSEQSKIHHTRGDGIGLWLCKRYITAHKSKIWIKESTIGKGTTICFSLPNLV